MYRNERPSRASEGASGYNCLSELLLSLALGIVSGNGRLCYRNDLLIVLFMVLLQKLKNDQSGRVIYYIQSIGIHSFCLLLFHYCLEEVHVNGMDAFDSLAGNL